MRVCTTHSTCLCVAPFLPDENVPGRDISSFFGIKPAPDHGKHTVAYSMEYNASVCGCPDAQIANGGLLHHCEDD